MKEIGIPVPASAVVHTIEDALACVAEIGFPAIIRPSFTMGGVGGGIAYNLEEFREICERGISLSPVHEVLVEQSVIGWKEYELEVMRDHADNFVVICSIENVDAMGVHTGDSITVAPAITLSDREYHRLRDAARRIIRRVGVETGGSNIQFAVNPANGDYIVIEMNPRVSRSSALASKATGFPIAKIAAKLALGYTLDEIPNDITRVTPASFEPTIDYVVVKFPRWAFEKFPTADATLTTQMKSVGEAMAIGRTFKEAFLKAVRSLELPSNQASLFGQAVDDDEEKVEALRRSLVIPNDRRMWSIFRALERGWTVGQVHELTHIDPWFLEQFLELVELGKMARDIGLRNMSEDLLRTLKRNGFGDRDIARLCEVNEGAVREKREDLGLRNAYKRIDTCAAEFESFTPYLYGTFERECEADPTPRKKVVILGSGPNRIGQGIEFDYCCCHAAFAAREEGFETVMINCNPETVSTDYDTVDRLYFEPLTLEDVLAVIERERSNGGDVSCVVQFGGQTPLKLALALQEAGVQIIGTSPDSIDLAEDRERFSQLLWDLGIPQPANGMAASRDEAREAAAKIGYPVVVRPSYVLGGRAMAIVYDAGTLDNYMANAVDVSPEKPILIDRFLEDAFELDVDAVADGQGGVIIGGVMEHIEEAGIHSGDSSCVVPTYLVAEKHLETIKDYTRRIARALNVIGLMNAQFAIKDDTVYVLEVNPRASRTVPYLSQGDRRAAGEGRGAADDRQVARRAGPGGRPRGHRRVREGAGVPVRALPGCRHHPRTRDEEHGRGDGWRVDLRHGVREGADRRRAEDPARRRRVHQRQQRRQGQRRADRARSGGARLQARRHARHGRLPARPRARGRSGLQDQRGPAPRRRPHRQQADSAGAQHAARPRVVLRRPQRAARGDDAGRAVHHHADRRCRHRQRDQGAARAGARRQVAAGVPRDGDDDGLMRMPECRECRECRK